MWTTTDAYSNVEVYKKGGAAIIVGAFLHMTKCGGGPSKKGPSGDWPGV